MTGEVEPPKYADAGACGWLETGEELTELLGDIDGFGSDRGGTGYRAFSGTKFNPDNPAHWLGSDALRYAIGIQMARDRGDFRKADAIRERVSRDYRVEQDQRSTTLYWIEVLGAKYVVLKV